MSQRIRRHGGNGGAWHRKTANEKEEKREETSMATANKANSGGNDMAMAWRRSGAAKNSARKSRHQPYVLVML